MALARALATSPGLLLLDEPLSALDAKVRIHLRHEIKELQEKIGITTIMVTHDQEEALAMADRIVVMNHGVIEQVGTPEEVYLNYINGPWSKGGQGVGSYGRHAENLGGNGGMLFMDKDHSLTTGSFTAFAVVCLNDQTEPEPGGSGERAGTAVGRAAMPLTYS